MPPPRPGVGPGWNRPGGAPGWNRPGGTPGAPAAPGRGNFVRHNTAPAAQPAYNTSALRRNTIMHNTINNMRNNGAGNRVTGSHNNTVTRPTTSRTPTVPVYNNGSTSRHTGGSTTGSGRNTGGSSNTRGRH